MTSNSEIPTHPSAPLDWPELTTSLIQGRDLSAEQAWSAMDAVMRGDVQDIALAGFLVALRAKGESVDELKGLADAMVSHARPLDVPGPAVDIVGTGGDRLRSVNISTVGLP